VSRPDRFGRTWRQSRASVSRPDQLAAHRSSVRVRFGRLTKNLARRSERRFGGRSLRVQCHSARCHTAGETCYRNVEPVLGDQHGGSKLSLVLLVAGSQVGSHRRSAWGRIEPAAPFDSGRSPGIQRRPATSADTRDLVRIEGVGFQIPSPAPRYCRPVALSDFLRLGLGARLSSLTVAVALALALGPVERVFAFQYVVTGAIRSDGLAG
jgi:hypothetical protein